MRRASRRDANHGQIVAAFEQAGIAVLDLADAPVGCDILVGFGCVSAPLEIKDPSKPPSKRALTPNEQELAARWPGGIRVVMTLDDVIEVAAMLRRWHRAIVIAGPRYP